MLKGLFRNHQVKITTINVVVSLFFGFYALSYNWASDWQFTFSDLNIRIEHAKNIVWNDPSTYATTFYPSLWSVIIKLFGAEHWVDIQMILMPIVYFFTISSLLFLLDKIKVNKFWQIVFVFMFASQFYTVLLYTRGLSDGVFTLVWVWGLYFALVARKWFLLGICIGIMSLLRHHGLMFGAMSFLFMVLPLRSKKSMIHFLAGCILAYLPQIGIDLSAGVPPFQTEQGFNMYKTFWHDLAPEHMIMPENLINKIIEHPTRIWYRYSNKVLEFWPLYFITSFFLLWAMKIKLARFKKILLTSLSVMLLATLGWSYHIIAPLAIVLVISGSYILSKRKFAKATFVRTVFVIIGILVGYRGVRDMIAFTEYNKTISRIEHDIAEKITALNEGNLQNDRVMIEPFTIALSRYFQGELSYLTQNHWYRFNNPNYNNKYPSIQSHEIAASPDSMFNWVDEYLDYLFVYNRKYIDDSMVELKDVSYLNLIKNYDYQTYRYNFKMAKVRIREKSLSLYKVVHKAEFDSELE